MAVSTGQWEKVYEERHQFTLRGVYLGHSEVRDRNGQAVTSREGQPIYNACVRVGEGTRERKEYVSARPEQLDGMTPGEDVSLDVNQVITGLKSPEGRVIVRSKLYPAVG